MEKPIWQGLLGLVALLCVVAVIVMWAVQGEWATALLATAAVCFFVAGADFRKRRRS